MIAQLKAEVQRLKDELAMATGQEYTGELTENEMDRYCKKLPLCRCGSSK